MKKFITAVLATVIALSVTACSANENLNESENNASDGVPNISSAEENSDPDTDLAFKEITYTDALGRTVTISQKPERVVTMIGSFADVWCLAGGKDVLVGSADDTWTQFDLGLPETVVNTGATREPSIETILAVKPDLIIASAKTEAVVDLLPTFESAGIKVVFFDISNFEEYLNMLEVCTKLTCSPESFEKYGVEVQNQIDAARAKAEGQEAQKVLYIRASGSTCKVKNSENSVLGEMLVDLGTVNIADSQTSLLEELSMETILAEDPDKVFIVMQGSDQAKIQESLEKSVLSNPAWQQLSAVKNGEVYYMDQALYNLKPNARWGEAYEGLVEILYGN